MKCARVAGFQPPGDKSEVSMKQRFDDEKYYSEEQDFGGVVIRNFIKVLKNYSYERYVKRFRVMAEHHRLAQSQRPKLTSEEYMAQMQQLWGAVARVGEARLLDDPKANKTARRLLVLGLFDEDLL